jgi:hypothetical protein
MFNPNQYAVLTACVQAFLNGAVGMHLPDQVLLGYRGIATSNKEKTMAAGAQMWQ